jgi:hypothetical protein
MIICAFLFSAASDPSSGYLNIGRPSARLRNGVTLLAQPLKVKFDSLLHVALDFFAVRSGRNAARQVRRVSRKTRTGRLDDNEVLHPCSFNPACLRMLLSVPGANSSPGLPGTVTRPGLLGCLNCRWLPLVLTNCQPSCSINLVTSRTFTSQVYLHLLVSGVKVKVRTGHG